MEDSDSLEQVSDHVLDQFISDYAREQMMDELDEQSENSDDEEERHEPLHLAPTRDQHLVKTALQNLIHKIDGYTIELDVNQLQRKVSPALSKKFFQLHKHLLLLLQRGFWRLCYLVLGPDHFLKNEPPEFQAELQVLKDIENILDRIMLATDTLWSPGILASDSRSRSDVNHHRCRFAESKLIDTMEKSRQLLGEYKRLFLISEMRMIRKLAARTWRLLIQHTRRFSDFLDTVINWFELSDRGAVQEQWQSMAEEVEDLLQHVVEFPLKNPGTHCREPLRDSIPLIKLSRIFFKKLSRATPSELHPIYQMSQAELSSLIGSTFFFPSVLESFVDNLEDLQDPPFPGDDEVPIFDLEGFLGTMKILDNYAHPQGSERAISHEFREWYMSWKQHFFLAVNTFQTTYTRVYSDRL